VLVTSRTYAYQRQDWKLRNFAEAVLAPFGEAQMHRFVDRWYAYVGQVRRLSATIRRAVPHCLSRPSRARHGCMSWPRDHSCSP